MICIFFDVFLSKINRSLDAGRKLNLHKTLSALCITAQKIKFSIKDFFGKCDQIRRKLRIWSHLMKKPLMKNFIFVQCMFNLRPVSRGRIFVKYLKEDTNNTVRYLPTS